MSVLSSGVRVGAAAFALGLSLAGPQALGVAAADSSDASSVSSDARNTGAGRAGSVERSAAARSVRRAGLGGAARASAAASVAESAGRSDGRSAPGLVQGRRVTTRAVATPGVVTGGVTSAAVNVSSGAGVGGRLFGGPVANAATSAAPAAATAASTRRPVTRRPTAAPPSDLNPVATANAQINSAFDSLANMLSGLPRGPVADFLGGALLLVRRSLFNQAPTANPVQYGQTETDIVGTLGAVDVEGNPITYIVSQAPQHGTVSIAADGFYTYTPDAFSATDSTDTFTVSVADSATRLLGPISTNVVVPVSIGAADSGSCAPAAARCGAAFKSTFTVYNWSQHSVTLVGIGGDGDLVDRPRDGQVVLPGHSFYYVLARPSNSVNPDYRISNGVYLRTSLNAGEQNLVYRNVKASSSADITEGDKNSIVIVNNNFDDFNVQQFILDPPNTSVVFTAPATEPVTDAEKAARAAQSDLINWMCGGGPAKDGGCGFTLKSSGEMSPGSTQLGAVKVNPTSAGGLHNYTYSFTATDTVSSAWEVNGKIAGKLSDKASVELGGKYGRTYTSGTSSTYSETLSQTLLPYSWSGMYVTPSFDYATGDVTVRVWNTTWTFKNVAFNYPSPSDCDRLGCKGTVTFRQEPYQAKPGQGGFLLKAEGSELPNEPRYYLGASGGDSYALKLTAYNGSGPTASADFTTNPAVAYQSSDPSVATISARGTLTVLTPGKSDITATYTWTLRGQDKDTTYSVFATLPVEVLPPKTVTAG